MEVIYMTEPILESKSSMLTPICDGDHIAAAILDWVYLYFQNPSPYELFFDRIQSDNSEEITTDFYRYEVQNSYAPFNLDIDYYPEKWLTVTLAEIHRAIQGQFVWGTNLS